MRSILRSCNLEGAEDYDTATEQHSATARQVHSSSDGLHASMKQYYAGRHCYFDDDGVFFDVSPWQRQQAGSLSSLTFSSWLKEVTAAAEQVRSSSKPAREALSKAAQELCTEYGSADVAITCGWSPAVTLGIVKGIKEVLDSVCDKEVSPYCAGKGGLVFACVYVVCVFVCAYRYACACVHVHLCELTCVCVYMCELHCMFVDIVWYMY